MQQNASNVRGQVQVRVVVGALDNTAAGNRDFSELLTKLSISHTRTLVPDVGHDPMALLRGLGESNWAFYRSVFPTTQPPTKP